MISASLIDAIRLLIFPGLMAFAAASDLLTMTISNKISLALACSFVGLALASGMSAGDVLMHVAAGAAVLAACFALFAGGFIGGGDAKLAAATVLWLGFEHLLSYLMLSAMLGGALTLLMLQFRLMRLPALLEHQAWAARLHRKDAGIPYGPALAAAALLIYPQTVFMTALGS